MTYSIEEVLAALDECAKIRARKWRGNDPHACLVEDWFDTTKRRMVDVLVHGRKASDTPVGFGAKK